MNPASLRSRRRDEPLLLIALAALAVAHTSVFAPLSHEEGLER